MHYFIIAGEASGDLHGAELIRALMAEDSSATFSIIGGDKMAAAASTTPIIHFRDMAYMGFSEVLRHLGDISRNLKIAKGALAAAKPDRLILIDYPSFNLKVAKEAKRLGIDTTYYISPKIWAWKKWRVRSIRKLIDRVCCIFPFEPDFYRQNVYDRAYYVGNPSVEEVDAELASVGSRQELFSELGIPERRGIIALLPGSRLGEIRNNLSIMQEVLRRFPQYRGVIAGAPSVPDEYYRNYTTLPIVRGNAVRLLAHSHAALVTSGTATLETALVGVPQIVMYRANGQRISYEIMKHLLKVRFVSLPNLIADREVVPEMLVHLCSPELVGDRLAAIMPPNAPARQEQIEGYAEIRRILGTGHAAANAARLIATK